MAEGARGLDGLQRRFPPLGFPIGVLYKFFDDQGNYLAAVVTYYAFIAIFPLMLLGTSILGFFVQGNRKLQGDLLNSALGQFPIIGDQLGRTEGLHGSTGGVIIGAITAIYGAMGLGQAIQNTVNTAWSVPRNSRPNPFVLRARSLLLLATAGVSVLALSLLSTLGANTELLGARLADGIKWLLALATTLIVGTMLTFLLRMATTRDHALKHSAPGAFSLALMWQGLQWVGAIYVDRVIKAASGMNATFALVLGLIGFIYLASTVGVLSIEMNVVVARRLWPRALLTPFTDKVDLTEADRRAYAGYALMARHKGFETVSVTFDGRDGNTHEIVMDPSWLQKGTRKLQRPRLREDTGDVPSVQYAPEPLDRPEPQDEPTRKVAKAAPDDRASAE